MNEWLINRLLTQSELLRRRPDVTFSEQIAPHIMSHEHPQSDIELSVIDQKRPFQIFLHHKNFSFDVR